VLDAHLAHALADRGVSGSCRGFGLLEATSFLCGACVMILEMTGSRLVAPFFGTSLVVWTALIGVVMASLCAGNWAGGLLADRRPERRVLARIVLLSAVCTGCLAWAGNAVLSFLGGLNLNLYLAVVLAALLIFALPSLLLGMVSPFVVRLAMDDVGTSGGTVGRFSALSSAGSILGTFLGGFILISLAPSGVILLMLATVLAVLALLLRLPVWKGTLLVLCLLAAAAVAAKTGGLPMMPVGVHIETPYNHISIVESNQADGRRVRILMTDPQGAQSLMYTDDPNELVSDYTKFYDLAFHFKPDTKNILMLGGGGYCVPRHVLAERPGVSFDVVELDPGITEAARQYFSIPEDPRLRIFHEDARAFLNREARDPGRRGSYDAVFMDVFGSWYSIPFHLATVEAAQRMHDLLSPDGVLIVNVIASLQGPRSGVFHGIYAALESVFPRLLIFPASASDPRYALSRQNLMIVAFRSRELPAVPPVPELAVVSLLEHQWLEHFEASVPAFTDAFAPVERYALMR
ncbi:fused MFS/spermidine synthase, partial [uncultured Fretibacterium sp.]|uniref:fused MFS/spermidine synthase n=1 Tax=uncultured Fretibacterium sp. TaxID=1678694 RepID=UPI002603148F